ncbi:phosphatidylinositol-3-phosphatase SAC1 [Hyalella azteca]|uniref:Phosphatidylinositol-3-phosphatase SAC1 n=1 Tax=Hyalella azteca TaxID=294128 RepID=A0A8B7P5W7_HYAAZ|nr:phosphatidylinositol-3-phosphatase SAC1 [Hyalella azteca]XP_018021347.1 phosphatidylinositol-3-phosphatase SAC1 [Hyalella azteca]XP_018021348.1 phosphatidylinositol-3-phosphatase SAC1 [Hyalella azteca]XP_018021349.1 phosphatidylinositol-3-phosphatase SAC1 [Hyalella azteca]XP_018021351.1 phosphatidylinositol-3-phosphatase SAC1 [Hyalella azteca]
MGSGEVHEELILHCTDDAFYLEPVSPPGQPIMVIDRVLCEVAVQDNKGQVPLGASRKTVYGVLGMIRLISGPYLILVLKRSKIGTLHRQTIWKLDAVDIIPFSRSTASLTAEQKMYNDKYLTLVQQALSTPYFYFSYTYDLTHTLQRLYYTAEDFLQMSLHERAEQRFVWNQHLMQDLILHRDAGRFCLPLMHGFVCIKQCSINGEWFTWSLVSRRSVYRAGTRMWTRGVDKDGAVANYVETEQIVEFRDFRTSFVQTRGSIPLFWKQDPDLRYKPPPTLTNDNHEEAFGWHFESQVMLYGRQVAVNLIDQKGSEGRLQEAFNFHVANSTRQMVKDNVKYEYFDFHHECRKMRWDRLSILMDRLVQDQETMGYFLLREGVVLREQDGVFRTNCIDCLDRTNVVQSMLARRHLQNALTTMGVLKSNQKIEDQVSFEHLYKNVWADHADIISIQYSGTGALKTDFTRTGKRTKMGLVQDGYNSAVRYIKNNFLDGDRQDGLDLLLGKHLVTSAEGAASPCPLRDTRDPRLLLLPFAFFFSLLMVFACVLLPSELNSFTLLSLLFWASMVVAASLLTLRQGRQLVNAPKLCSVPLSGLSNGEDEKRS